MEKYELLGSQVKRQESKKKREEYHNEGKLFSVQAEDVCRDILETSLEGKTISQISNGMDVVREINHKTNSWNYLEKQIGKYDKLQKLIDLTFDKLTVGYMDELKETGTWR
jgi:hypothetical protein